jgi:hypothetical protein
MMARVTFWIGITLLALSMLSALPRRTTWNPAIEGNIIRGADIIVRMQ